MDNADRVAWLQQHTELGEMLGDQAADSLAAIAAEIQIETVPKNRRLALEDTPPPAFYILKSGRIESYRTRPNSAADVLSLLPGSLLYFKDVLLDRAAERTAITLFDSEVWTVPRDRLLELAERYPALARSVSQQLADELSDVTAQLAFEQERQTALRPYLVARVRRGIVGSSRYAVRLRQAIKKASQDRQPVMIFGEPGLGKDNAAALIHFGGGDRKQPMIKLNGDMLQPNGSDLFGRVGGKPGLLNWLGTGTLLLNNAEDIPAALKPKLLHLIDTGEYSPITREGEPPPESRTSQARIILTTERTLPDYERQCKSGHVIKVPPLRVRKGDIDTQATYYINLYCKGKGITRPQLTPEALRRLQSYDFPGNLSELESLVERAIIQSNSSPDLTEEVFWSSGSSKNRRFRFNLLNSYPWLRRFLRSPWWPDRINYGLVLGGFAVVVAVLMLGPQSRDRNIALNLFWAWWWPLGLAVYLFLGRIWCAVCPFMIYGELAQWLSLKLWPRQLLPWPRREAEQIGGWFLFGLFTLILLWEEVWNLENTAYLSGCLLLLITAGAVIFSLLFERRFWCRYLCPIGGMNGLFAKLSMLELRAQQGICSASCTTYQCYKGGPEKGEGQETNGCPVYSHPAQLQDNRDCVLCMTCLKACPHRSVELNLRPPGIELWTTHKPTAAEVCLLFLLWGAVVLHRLPEVLAQGGWGTWAGLDPDAAHRAMVTMLGNSSWHLALGAIALLIPGAIALLAHAVLRLVSSRPRRLVELAYGYLPLVLTCNLAHYLRLGLTEMGRVVPVSLATVGMSGGETLVAVAHPAVIAFLQGVLIVLGVGLSVVLTQKIARQAFLQMLPQHVATLGLAVWIWQLVVGV